MSLVEHQHIFLQHVSQLIEKANELGMVISGGELYRTAEQQQLHIDAGRSTTMNSQHVKRLAIDLNFFSRDHNGKLKLDYQHDCVFQLGEYWESLDDCNNWGGNWNNFKDFPHFERKVKKRQSALITASGVVPIKKGVGLIKDTVGFKGKNQREDVEIIQRLINLNRDKFDLTKALVCDGIYGSNTSKAILAYEKVVLGEEKSDRFVKPNDETIASLCLALPVSVDKIFLSLLYLQASEQDIKQMCQPIIDCMKHYNIDQSPLRVAHFLAQIGHESGELRFKEEVASGSQYNDRRDLGNNQPGDGQRFKGRGLIQLTGRANYTEYTKLNRFDVDVVNDPAEIASNMDLCVDVAGWFWESRGLNGYADEDKLETVTRRINGGLNGIDHRRRLYKRCKALLGI